MPNNMTKAKKARSKKRVKRLNENLKVAKVKKSLDEEKKKPKKKVKKTVE
jgi:hypothetical protein